jgi:hypothetical protein
LEHAAQCHAQLDGTRLWHALLADRFGVETFTYTISDGGLTATARVTVTINPNDHAHAERHRQYHAGNQCVAADDYVDGIGQGAPYENQSLDYGAVNIGLNPQPDRDGRQQRDGYVALHARGGQGTATIVNELIASGGGAALA